MLAFPLAIELMAASDFPFGALGLVHVGNEIEQLRPLDAAEPLDLRVWADQLGDHPRGRTVDIVAEARVDGALAWRDRSTYLHRESEATGRQGGAARAAEPPAPNAEWRVPGDIGRRYAAVSGDRNPIHMHGLSARLFGQQGAIAHGMWTKARCLAALQGHLPDAFTVEVRVQAAACACRPRSRSRPGPRGRAPLRAARRAQRQAAPDRRGQPAGRVGLSGLISSPAAQSAISVASRRSRVSGRFALITHHVAVLR